MKGKTSKVIHTLGTVLMIGTILLIVGSASLSLFSNYRISDFFESQPQFNNTNYNQSNQNTPVNASKNNNSNNTNHCNLPQSEALKYLAKQSFSVSGKSVSFSTRYDYQKQQNIPNEFIINGHGSRILGQWKMNGSNSIYLSNVKQISGSFDPTTNYALNGYLNLQCNGNLTGSIGRGSKQTQLNIIKNN